MEHSNFFKVVIIAGFFILSSPAGPRWRGFAIRARYITTTVLAIKQ